LICCVLVVYYSPDRNRSRSDQKRKEKGRKKRVRGKREKGKGKREKGKGKREKGKGKREKIRLRASIGSTHHRIDATHPHLVLIGLNSAINPFTLPPMDGLTRQRTDDSLTLPYCR